MSRHTIGVILSGCGVQDGSEIHEAVLTLLALDRAGVTVICMAPDRPQADVVDHLTGRPQGEARNVLTEAARIARGQIRDVASVGAEELDAVVLPGGYGAAKNLSTFARDGAACSVDAGTAALMRAVHADGKPIAALCIAPAVLAAVFGRELHPLITIGTDPAVAQTLESMGARHCAAEPTGVVVDREARIVTTPCYMSAKRVREVAEGIDRAVDELLSLLAGSPRHAGGHGRPS